MPIVAGHIKTKGSRRKIWVTAGLLLGLLAFSAQGWAEEATGTAGKGDGSAATLKRARHMEFDERLIMGQSLKSGALYLFERKDSEIQTMLKIRRDYRQELLAPLEPPP
jgi:hypothetical protein